MTLPAIAPGDHDENTSQLNELARQATRLGGEIVEVSGILDEIDADSRAQIDALAALRNGAKTLLDANRSVEEKAVEVKTRAEASQTALEDLIRQIHDTMETSTRLSDWVAALEARVGQVAAMLSDVHKSNDLVSSIANQVNILAINAKIEAARAGDAGRGFAVVAEEVNALSRKTGDAAASISSQVNSLGSWIDTLSEETQSFGALALSVRQNATQTDNVLGEVQGKVEATKTDADEIVSKAVAVREAGDGFGPTFARIGESASDTGQRIVETRDRLYGLVDLSEGMLQGTVAAGGMAGDSKFIDRVTSDAAELSRLLEAALEAGDIGEAELFSETYTPIPGSDPQQVQAPFTGLIDRLFPEVQEAALQFDDRVVFCAAVDRNGYLPTHNRKFSQPHGSDPVWNAANGRNRRIFDDRVGLKAGQNTKPFLLQVYRRDMGGGEFRMMKDLSAPIVVRGRPWGGLRLAYTI